MVEYRDEGNERTVTYGYDCFGRRFRKVVTPDGDVAQERIYLNGGPAEAAEWQVLEEYVPGFGYLNSNVWGSYIDELVQRRYDQFNGDPMTGVAYYSLTDDLFSVTAVTDDSGAVVERYEYGDYGKPKHMDANGFPANFASMTGNTWFFTGREWDGETGFYHYRTRYMESGWGRFTTVDILGNWSDTMNWGGGTTYGASSPVTLLDVFGEKSSRMRSPKDQRRDPGGTRGPRPWYSPKPWKSPGEVFRDIKDFGKEAFKFFDKFADVTDLLKCARELRRCLDKSTDKWTCCRYKEINSDKDHGCNLARGGAIAMCVTKASACGAYKMAMPPFTDDLLEYTFDKLAPGLFPSWLRPDW